MQISRMFEMLYLLLDNERMSAGELARRLEVSVRTVYRDAQALSEAGIPIYAERGRSGGLCILPTCKLSRALLSEEDRRSILASLRALQQSGAEDSATLRKMTAFLGDPGTDWVQIDLSDWSGQQGALLTTLKTAILGRRIVAFRYYAESGACTERSICPMQLLFKGRTWYLRAYCLLRGDHRLFKLTRIKRAQIVPGDFPAQALSAPPEQKEQKSGAPLVSLLLRIDGCMAFRVYDDFGEEQIALQPDGSFLVRASYPRGPWLASFVLSYGAHAQVLQPQALREEIAGTAKNLLALYKT